VSIFHIQLPLTNLIDHISSIIFFSIKKKKKS